MSQRVKFWWQALSRGVDLLNSAAGFVGLAILILGATAGIIVPLVFHVSHWLTAVVLTGIFLVVMVEGSYRVWELTDRQRKTALEAVRAKREDRKPKRAHEAYRQLADAPVAFYGSVSVESCMSERPS